MRSYIKALIFDLDGTLANTLPAITEAVNIALSELGFPARTEIEVKGFIGQGPRHLMSESLPKEARESDPALVDAALVAYDRAYATTYLHTDTLYDGMEDAILHLSKYYKIAVLSNKQDHYVKALTKQLLPQGICQFAYGTLNGVPAKPSPTLALKLAHDLEVEPHECMLIGDSEIDILTAQNAGFDILSVSWGFVSKTKLVLKGAENIINSPDELIEYFY